MLINASKHTTLYGAKGTVKGKLWGGGEGEYYARSLGNFKKKAELYTAIQDALKDGSLDSGMGFEKLLHAHMDIIRTESYVINGKKFTHQICVTSKRFNNI